MIGVTVLTGRTVRKTKKRCDFMVLRIDNMFTVSLSRFFQIEGGGERMQARAPAVAVIVIYCLFLILF